MKFGRNQPRSQPIVRVARLAGLNSWLCRIEKNCGLLSQHYHYGAEVSQCRERAGKAFCASRWFPVLFISRPRRHGRSRSRLDSVADLRDSYVDTN